MPQPSTILLVALTTLITLGTLYSVVYDTYLDTSNPLLTHLPHPLHKNHYFADKKNVLNIHFIKRVWAWVTAAFIFLYATSPPPTRNLRRVVQYFVATGVWLVFTGWFFGPSLLDRFIASTGGSCVLTLPSGAILHVPHHLCFTKSTVSPATHPSLFTSPFTLPDGSWSAVPRLRRGHDVSGHLFLLTMSVLFLADQLRHSFTRIRSRAGKDEPVQWSPWHWLAVLFNAGVLLASVLAVYTTSVYFHTPTEKLSGFVLGVAGYSLTQLAPLRMTNVHQPIPVIEKTS